MSIENPPAFPKNGGFQDGMTLRDYFAGQAVTAMDFIRGDGSYSAEDRKRGEPEQHAKWIAISAYRIADAMLAARQKGTPDE